MEASDEETKAKILRRMRPFTRDQLQLIRGKLKAQGAVRDLALFNMGVDTMLRGGDLVRLRIADVLDFKGEIIENFPVIQDKTDKPVYVQLTPKTRASVGALIKAQDKWSDDYLFTKTRDNHGKHLSEVSLRQIVKGWAEIAEVDPEFYSGHSMRRSKAVIVYRETRDVEIVRQMLGHSSLAHTIAYLGVDKEDVAAVALRFDV